MKKIILCFLVCALAACQTTTADKATTAKKNIQKPLQNKEQVEKEFKSTKDNLKSF